MKKFKYERSNDSQLFYVFLYTPYQIIESDTVRLDSYVLDKYSNRLMGCDVLETCIKSQHEIREPFLTLLLAFRI